MRQKPQVPKSFTAKKNAILVSLSTPENAYTDFSPKGSVDAAIKPLIDRINALEGVVTTSSCAGRVSVFLEGMKQSRGCEDTADNKDDEVSEKESEQVVVPGGKGMGGKWLFVSHDPIELANKGGENKILSKLLGLGSLESQNEALAFNRDIDEMRFVRFQFEPMILHVMAASLHHAQPILAAAITAGFRESGIQSLKNLENPYAFPFVAIRTAGLAFASLIGLKPNCTYQQGHAAVIEGSITRIVSEEYLEILVNIANDRFKANAERTLRFEQDLFKGEEDPGQAWEDSKSRQERKRAEGLEQQQKLRRSQMGQESGKVSVPDIDGNVDSAGLFCSSLSP